MNFKISIAFSIFILSMNSFALNRLNPSIEKIEKLMKTVASKNNPASYILNTSARVLAFNTQSIARLYRKEESNLSKVYKDYKKLEDLIGGVKKWKEILDYAVANGASNSKIKNLQQNLESSERILNDFLKQGWLDQSIFKIHYEKTSFLDDLSDEQERELTLSLVVKSLNKFDRTKFDLSYLEHGDGLHEFRRELRWQIYNVVNLGGLIDYKRNVFSCSLVSFDKESLTKINKYTKITKIFNEESCLIDYCLINEIALMVSHFGVIKDEVEGYLNTIGINDDRTPAAYYERAISLELEWENKNVISTLVGQLNQCQSN